MMPTFSKATKQISVCLCTYNGSRFLREQLDSILAQTLLPDEIVVVDDCSTDSTFEILQEYQAADPLRFRIFHNSFNLGYKKNFAKVLSLSLGELIFFADQDDVWSPSKVADFCSIFSSNSKTTVVCCALEKIDDAGNSLGPSLFNRGMSNLVKKKSQWKSFAHHPLIPGTAMAVRRSLVESYWPIPDGFLHDEWFSLCSSFDNGISYLPRRLVNYRQHTGQAIGDPKKTFAEKKNASADFDATIERYSDVCSSSRLPASVKALFEKRSLFLGFRKNQRQKSFLSAFFRLLIHPRFIGWYFLFCDEPFASMGKDLFVVVKS
jgi:glycosyltransferase involved in cell wall biosynthesis